MLLCRPYRRRRQDTYPASLFLPVNSLLPIGHVVIHELLPPADHTPVVLWRAYVARTPFRVDDTMAMILTLAATRLVLVVEVVDASLRVSTSGANAIDAGMDVPGGCEVCHALPHKLIVAPARMQPDVEVPGRQNSTNVEREQTLPQSTLAHKRAVLVLDGLVAKHQTVEWHHDADPERVEAVPLKEPADVRIWLWIDVVVGH